MPYLPRLQEEMHGDEPFASIEASEPTAEARRTLLLKTLEQFTSPLQREEVEDAGASAAGRLPLKESFKRNCISDMLKEAHRSNFIRQPAAASFNLTQLFAAATIARCLVRIPSVR